ncbi:hypothetical protein BASA81_005065 [Batrachochytrium salamandrivorans]|nr:hypothetical protein BASA81_005065 [Batrachochytrium salamandrivorans]
MGPEPLKLLRRLVRDLGHVVGARSSDLLNGGELGETAVAGQQQGSKSLASNIQAVVTTDLEPTHYALASSLIFDTKMGVIWILRAARNQRQHDDAKTILLNTLASFIPLLGESVMQCYASQTISICISMFISHEIARVKLATFGPISQILELGFDESTVGLAAKKIFDSYYMEYIQQYSKLSPSVRGAILRVLGFISRKYPGCISVQHREQLLRHLLKSISTLFAMDKNAMSIQHVGGAMNGLNQFMLQTPLSREEDILLVYKCIVFVIQPIDDLARYDLPRAGLQILIDNSYVFVPHLLKDWETLYSHLEHMSSHKNRQMSRLALTAFEQFLKHVSEMLLLNVDGSEERSCFSFIIAKLNYKLTTPDLPISDVSLAIRGFGIFASACKAFWGLCDLIDLTQAVIRRGSQFYNNANVVSEDHLLHIPSFFVSLSHICKGLENITPNLVHVIGMIADVMLLYFPNIGLFVQNACCDAFIQLLWSLHSTHHSFLNIWRQTASKALLLTSAVTIPMSGDSLLNATGRIAEQAHKEYLHFWTGIFDLRCISSIDASRNAAIEVFRNLLFDEFMRAVITFPQSLNLSTTNPSIQSISTVSSGKNHLQQDTFDPNASFGGLSRKCDPAASVYNAELAAVNPKDHQSLVCFVEFCEIFMLGEHKTRLSRWILMLSEAWARMSNRYVLVSGFYRLFALNLKLSVDLGLFDGSGGDQRYTADCQALFSSHIIQVLNRMGLFKDELLNSCLSMVLSTPTSIVSVLKLKDAMCRALTLGISYAPLAVVALDTLKRWIKRVDCDTMHQVLSHVLPHLAEYLVADTEDTLDNPIPDLHVPNKVAFSITKMRQKRLQTSHTTFPIDPEDLKQIQSMVVFILGHVGRANRLVLGHEDSEISVSWNIEMAPVLFFDVPFHKTTTRIYFDEILPRIVYLAESSPDRKTKVSAVELLYSLIIMMLGRSEFGPGSIAFTIKKFHQIFGKLFPCMFRLAVDLESVSRSLFKPLTLQLIHWLTQPTNKTDSEAAVLLTACMDAATSDCENLRDFGSECISEFLRYYLKHASDVRLNGGPESICDVIIRIHRLLIHHDSHKRAGACMIVNRIYGILCENEIMVQTFAVESLYYVLCALQLADGDEPSIGTTTLAQKTVDTVSKIILDRIALFETVDERRRSFPGLVRVDLMSLLGWLYEQFGSREVAHAQVCIKLFVQFSSIVSDAKTLFDKFATVSSSGLPMNLVPRVLFSNWKIESPSDLRTLTRMDHGCTEMVAIAMFGLLRLLKRIISEHTDIESLGTTDIYALLSEPLFQTIALSVFSPSTLGLDLGLNSGLLCNWDALLQDVLGIFHAKLTVPIRKSILLTLVSAIDPFVLQLSHLNQATSLAHHTMQLHGLKLLKDTAWMDELSNSGVLNSLHQGLLSLCVYSSESDPVILSVASELLDVCLSIPIHRSFICSDLLMLTRHDVCLEAIRFYQTFRRTIDMSFAAKLDDYYPLLEGNWTSPQARMAIMGMLDSLLDFPELYQETIVQLNQTLPWSIHLLKGIFSRGDSNDAFISRSIFSRICLVFDPRTIHSPEFTKIMSSELAYLLGTQFSLAEKHHTVQLLAPFASIDADVETQMAQLIKETIEMQFPISPRDIIVLTGTDQYTYYISFVETILHGVEQYGSAAIGECIFTHLCRDDHGIFTAQIQISMYRMGCNLSIPKVVIFMDMCMRSFQSSIIKMAVRGNIIRDVLVPILLGVDIDVLTSFFVKHIKTIMGIISSPLSMAIDPLYLDLTTKTACYRIMEIAYIRLPYAKLHHKSGEVISAYTSPFLPTDERALSLPLMKHSHAAKSEAVSVTDPDDMAPLRLRYHQAAYAVLSATICKTQSKSEVFKVFLFSENPAKGERHWENLVDLNANLSTILDFHTTEDLALSNRTHQMNSDPVSLDTIGEKDKPRLNFKLSGTSTTQESLEFGSTQIEDMHLPFSRDISSVVVASLRGEACKAPTLPGVISACAAELIRGFKKEAPFPIKTFIVKIILSHSEYFEEFKSEFWKPLAILLSDENTFVDGLSSLAQEIIIRLVLWSTNTDGSRTMFIEASETNRLIVFDMMRGICGHCTAPSRSVTISNDRLIWLLIESFKDLVIAPTYILYQALFIPEDAPGKDQSLGAVYLLSAFVSCGIPIYTGIGIETLAISEGTFLDRLVELCQNSSKDLCTATAELLGQLLELFERDKYILLSYLVLAVRKMLKKLSQVTSELYRRDRFVLIINRISSKFPAILKEFDKSLLYILPQLFGSTKELCLKALCTYASKSVDMFVELRGRGLLGLLSDRDDECQRLTVMILSEIVLHLSVDDVMYFKDTLIAAFSTHPNEDCRKAYFLLIVGIVKTNFGNNLESITPSLSTTQSLSPIQSVDCQEHSNDHDIDTQMIDERAYASDIIACLCVCLLKGLADKCDDIRNNLAQYIEAHILGAKPILERTVQIFKCLYSPEQEDYFLQYATRFLLDASQISANFDVDIFPSSPEEVPFRNLVVDTSWTINAIMQPMFSAQSILLSKDGHSESQDLYTVHENSNVFPSHRYFSKFATHSFLVPRIPVYYDKSKKNLLGPSEKYRDSEFALLRGLKRVYVKRNAAEERDYFSAKALRLKSKIQKAEHLQKLARSRQVNLSRSYRVGEYPDMKIKPSSFLKPLWTLTQRDADISKFVLSKLVSSIMISSKKDGCSSGIIDDGQEIQYSISSDLADVISDTMRCSKLTSPAFIGSMLKILYDTSCTVIEPQLIATASVETGNENLGVLLLEKSIQSLLSEDSVHQGAALLASWVSVAQMYKSIGSLDVYHAINETHLYFSKATKDAIYFSSIGEYLEAKSIFEKSLAGPIEHISAEEICVWKQGILECYSKLFQWEDLEERIISDTGNPLSSIDTKPLPLYIQSFIRCKLQLSATNVYVHGMDQITDPSSDLHRDYFELHHSYDLALIFLKRKDYNQSWHFVNCWLDSFSDQYSSLGSMSKQTKSLLLNSLQKATELRDALVQLRGQLELGNLLKGWERTFPSYTDDVDIWADLFLLRETVLDQWPVANDIDREAIRIAKNTLHGEIAKSAYEQHNFHLATVCISRMMPSDGDFHAEGILAGFYLNIARMNSVHISSKSKADYFVNLFSDISYYETNIKALPELLWIKFTIAESISLWTILKQMVEHPYDVGQLLIGNKRLLCAFDIKFSKVPTHEESLGQLINQLAFNGFKHVKSNMDEKLRRQATILIAEQCDQVLRWIEAKDPTVSTWTIHKSEYACIVVRAVISNMISGDRSSREMFPRLLQILEQFPETRTDFSTLCVGLAPWMLLRWISQMTAVLDKPYGDIILPLLYRVSSIFPSAVIYPLQISIPQYTFTRESTLSLGQIKGLLHSVSLPLATTFLKELRRLIEPVHIFKDWIEHTELIFNSGMSNLEIQIKLAFDEMKEYCFETHSFSCQGVKKFSKKHCKRVLEICGSDGSRLVTQKKLIWKEIKMYYARSISGKESFPLGTMPIDYYSPWLAKYRLSDHPNDTLLIPGQYEGSHQPVTGSDFVKISSFEPVVDVLGSIRRPKKLGFVGSDGKVYPFLIKGGEDLRLDQRVEHMFSTINSIILNNRQCGNANLSIRVYGVVPMTRTLGVLEWVENTRTLRQCMSDISGFQEAFVKADKQFENFVSIYRGQAKSVGEIYGNMFMKASSEDVTAMMKSLWGTMEKPYFKMFMQNLAASPEAYVNIRSGFANSWASLSIASYLMGIGDRHTDNFLVDLKSGRVIGIDFGHAFGSATEVLPVPELVPFRLTQQIKEFVDPLGIHVMLEPPMIHVMTALREKKDMIMTALDIFVKEPLIEWQKFAISQYKRKASRTEPSTESSGMDTNTLGELKWYPQQKLEIAARKLMGEHPSHIQATELRWGHATKPYVSQACEVLLGTKNNSHRSRVGVRCESIREQVQCLIDQATDPNVLGRAWRGWVSWC